MAPPPGTTVSDVVKLDTLKFWPVPESGTVCGLLDALSVSVTAPDKLPATVGVNVTLMAHEPVAANSGGQLLVWAKSPEAAMPLIVSV